VLLYELGKTPDDRLFWQSADASRSVLDILAECTLFTRNWAEILARGESLSDEAYFGVFSGMGSLLLREVIENALTTETSNRVSVTRGIPDEKLSDELRLMRGESAPLGSWLHWAAIHNGFELGRIAYIQRLCGDTEN